MMCEPLCSRAQAIPSAATFVQSVELAWAAALMQAKAIVRDEPWSAKVRDQELKEELLNMVVWDHICRYGPDFDTHFLGARMRRWMDVLQTILAHGASRATMS